jgi:hypothetical protein
MPRAGDPHAAARLPRGPHYHLLRVTGLPTAAGEKAWFPTQLVQGMRGFYRIATTRAPATQPPHPSSGLLSCTRR